MADLRRSNKRHIKPEGQTMHQAWVHHVELKGNLYPGSKRKMQKTSQ